APPALRLGIPAGAGRALDGKRVEMCGRVIQVSGPLSLAIVDGLDVRDRTNVPRRFNAAPSQELLVIRQNHQTGERSLDFLKWGLIPYWCNDPKGEADQRQSRDHCPSTDVPRRLCSAQVHRAGRRFFRVEGHQGPEGETAV